MLKKHYDIFIKFFCYDEATRSIFALIDIQLGSLVGLAHAQYNKQILIYFLKTLFKASLAVFPSSNW